jgi:hypothetical protein
MNDLTYEASQLRSQLHDLESRVGRIEAALGLDQVSPEAMTRIKALIKNGSNAWFNGLRENPHPAGSREHELWQYGADLARDIADDR